MRGQRRSHPQVVGPLAPLAGELLDELRAHGYSPSWSVVQLRLLAGLRCWLEDKELGGEGISAGVLAEFSAARIAAGGPISRVLLPGGGPMRFLSSVAWRWTLFQSQGRLRNCSVVSVDTRRQSDDCNW